jgi:hypothetical protein
LKEKIIGKAAANEFAKGYEKESNTYILPSRKKEVRTELRERPKVPTHDLMQGDITMFEMKADIMKMKKTPGPDNITNEMLQHLNINNFARDSQPELETRSSPSKLERSHNDANIEEEKEQVESLKLPPNLPNKQLLQINGAHNQQASTDILGV